ncbi:hypothetical protein Dimus_008828 [Dionaea muscipula]
MHLYTIDHFYTEKQEVATRTIWLAQPIVGNLFDLGAKPHQSLAKLAKIHDPIFSLRIGFKTTVVVSSPSAAKEVLLQKSDALFSNRTPHHHHDHSMAPQRCSPTADWSSPGTFARGSQQAGKAINVGQLGFTTMINLLSNTFFSVVLVDPSNSPNNNNNTGGEFKDLIWAVKVEVGKPNISDFFPMLKIFDLQGSRRRMTGLMENLLKLFDSLVQQWLEMRKSDDYEEKNNDVLDTLLSIYVGKTEQIDLESIRHLLLVSHKNAW